MANINGNEIYFGIVGMVEETKVQAIAGETVPEMYGTATARCGETVILEDQEGEA